MAPGRRPTVNRNPPVNRSTNRNNVDINSGIDTQMLNQLIATRVAEASRCRCDHVQASSNGTTLDQLLSIIQMTTTRNSMQSCMKTSVENNSRRCKRKWNRTHYPIPQQTLATSTEHRPRDSTGVYRGQGSYAGKLPHCGKCGRHHTTHAPPALLQLGRNNGSQRRWKPNSRQPTKSLSTSIGKNQGNLKPAPIEVVKIGHLQTLLRLTQQSSGINRRLAIKDHFFDYQSMRRIVGSAVLFSPLALLLLHILCQIVDIEAVHRYAFMIIQLRPKRLCLRNMSLSVRRPELSTDHRYPLIRDSPGRDRSY
ncbi:hypothetical protein Tco_1055960 [Tanacetum coccineum]|uniref:Uncharacterized protein n=1 Tax=Tanacetum coccineum TaxID=301880 RepID=A0ABQ5H153_9ASTR